MLRFILRKAAWLTPRADAQIAGDAPMNVFLNSFAYNLSQIVGG
jgi:hypothetical protein